MDRIAVNRVKEMNIDGIEQRAFKLKKMVELVLFRGILEFLRPNLFFHVSVNLLQTKLK